MRDELMKVDLASPKLCEVEEGSDITALFIQKCRLYSCHCSVVDEEDREYLELKKDGLNDMVQFVTDYK
jgi:hypothetical protein